jgi:hypothetical protein
LNNFEQIQEFDLYRFILEIFDHFTLEVTPLWKFGESHPIELPLIQLVRIIYEYGVVSIQFTKKLAKYLYLYSDVLRK